MKMRRGSRVFFVLYRRNKTRASIAAGVITSWRTRWRGDLPKVERVAYVGHGNCIAFREWRSSGGGWEATGWSGEKPEVHAGPFTRREDAERSLRAYLAECAKEMAATVRASEKILVKDRAELASLTRRLDYWKSPRPSHARAPDVIPVDVPVSLARSRP